MKKFFKYFVIAAFVVMVIKMTFIVANGDPDGTMASLEQMDKDLEASMDADLAELEKALSE